MGLEGSPSGHLGAVTSMLVTAAHSPGRGGGGHTMEALSSLITSGHVGLLTFLQAHQALSPARAPVLAS